MNYSGIKIKKCSITGILLHDKTALNTKCHTAGKISKNWDFEEGILSGRNSAFLDVKLA